MSDKTPRISASGWGKLPLPPDPLPRSAARTSATRWGKLPFPDPLPRSAARTSATRWAITGGAGFLGLRLARRLVGRGESVRSLDRLPLTEPGVVALRGDVRTRADVLELCAGADVLVHAAAALPSAGREQTLRSVNVEGTATVLAAAAEAGVGRVVCISSAVVYGLAGAPFHEEAPPAPVEAYGRSKLEADRLALTAGAVVLRPTAFVGPGRRGVFGILFDWIREGRRIYTLGSGSNRYQLLDVDDLVDAVLLSAERPVAGEILNLGASVFGTVAEDLQQLTRLAGSQSRITAVPARPARLVLAALATARLSPLSSWHYRSADRDIVVDTARARGLLGWAPRSSNVDALARAYAWHVAGPRRVESPGGPTHRARWNERALALVRRLS